jgi:hypothetical protein
MTKYVTWESDWGSITVLSVKVTLVIVIAEMSDITFAL